MRSGRIKNEGTSSFRFLLEQWTGRVIIIEGCSIDYSSDFLGRI